jgi:hypothetical protein
MARSNRVERKLWEMRKTFGLGLIPLLCVLTLRGIGSPALASHQRPLGSDPGSRGPLAVTRIEYDAGITPIVYLGGAYPEELRGSIHLPSGQGPFPLVVFLHGMFETCRYGDAYESIGYPCPDTPITTPMNSFEGFDYIAEALASHGYIVVSVSANGTNTYTAQTIAEGAEGRARLLAKTLDLLAAWNANSGPSPVDGNLVGKIDLTRIGMMGHSRGGEGVARFVTYNRERIGGPRYPGVRAVLGLAATDFVLREVTGVVYGTILPLCDGDVYPQDGAKTFEHGRKLDRRSSHARVQWILRGGNHNAFNTVWAPIDDAFYNADPPSDSCNPQSPASIRLSNEEQQEIGQTLLAGFFRRYVGGETTFDPLMTGAASLPFDECPATLPCEEVLRTSYIAPWSHRAPVSNLLGKTPKRLTAEGGTIRATGFDDYEVCDPTPVVYYLWEQVQGELCPTVPNRSWTPQFTLAWDQRANWKAELVGASASPTAGSSLHLRVAINQSDPRNPATGQDFDVRLTDRQENSAVVLAASFTNALQPVSEWAFDDRIDGFLFNEPLRAPNIILSDVRIPLGAFAGINTSALSRLELSFGTRTPTGSIQLADVAFQVS